jgi:hypothetical protein
MRIPTTVDIPVRCNAIGSRDRRIHTAADISAGPWGNMYMVTRCGIDMGAAWSFSAVHAGIHDGCERCRDATRIRLACEEFESADRLRRVGKEIPPLHMFGDCDSGYHH